MGDLLHRLASKFARLRFVLFQASSFAALGRHAFLFSPFRVEGRGIELGEASVFQSGAWLYCAGDGTVRLRIGKGCVFGYNNHITAVGSVTIGNAVLTANNVYISDNLHGYEDIARPIMEQPVKFKGPVEIGDGSWIGENACIIGASIGKNCVVGANAVVTSDIPDYCVVVGAPARIIRRYDTQTGQWITVDKLPIPCLSRQG